MRTEIELIYVTMLKKSFDSTTLKGEIFSLEKFGFAAKILSFTFMFYIA